MSPCYGEVWYLRSLLLRRPTYSFNQLKTSEGILRGTFEECARSLGLVQNENEYHISMEEAARFYTPKEPKRLFVTLILHGAPTQELWNQFSVDMSNDFAIAISSEASNHEALKHVDLMSNKHDQFGPPQVTHDISEFDRPINAFNTNELKQMN